MTRPAAPPREVAVDDALVLDLLRAQAPALAHLPRTVAAEGWDNVLVRLGEDLVLRLPRRQVAAPLVLHEQRWLPELAALLPVAVPVPVLVGRPQGAYPWSWSITPWLDGVRAADRPRAAATAWAADLARVLAALHSPAPEDAPHNPVRAVPLATRDAVVTERLARGLAAGVLPVGVIEVWRAGLAASERTGPALWVHGDPHPGNLLVRPGRHDSADALVSLLDFGDLSAGDPACDLATAWLTFDAVGRERFVAAYDAASAEPLQRDPDRWLRAAAWAVSMASSVLVEAPDDDANGPWARAALAALLT